MLRPENLQPQVEATRSGRTITFRNIGNTNVELIDGKQCDAAGQQCRELGAKRLYEGASWTETLTYDTPVDYSLKTDSKIVARRF